MKCKQAEHLMTISVYATPTEEEKAALAAHIDQCDRCSLRWEKAASFRKEPYSNFSVDRPDPDRSWAVIARRLSERRRISNPRLIQTLISAAAVLLVVFIAGIFFGRRIFLVPPASTGARPILLSEASLESYADFLQPVLVNFINRGGSENSRSLQRLERSIVSDLLDRTRQLRSLLPENGGSALQDLLQDLEFILTAMDNLEPGDGETARHLAGLIREKEVSFRLHQLIRTQTTL
jgi:hypothetical protein